MDEGMTVAIKAKLGAGVWDLLFCQDCDACWTDHDIDYTWTDDPEIGETHCPSCGSGSVVREERG